MAANFLIRFVVVTTVCALLYGGDVESAGGGHKEGGAGAAHSYPELTKLLKGASLTFRGKVVNLNRLDSTTANDLLKNYFSEDGLEAGLERIVRLAAVNHQIAIQKGLEVDSFEIDELASDENIRILEDMDELESTVNDNKESNDGETHRDKRSVSIGTDHSKWPNTTIAVVIPDVYTADQKVKLKAGLKAWEDVTCLRFNLVKSHVGPQIKFGIGRGCGSSIGMANRKTGQTISITSACMSVGTIAHELGHALGFYHEQDRPDRDLYIKVLEKNIQPNRLSNYQKRTWNNVKTFGIPYDYTSLLHYREYQFSKNKNKTISTVDEDMHETVGNKKKLSFFDAKTANYQYCTGVCKEGLDWDRCQNGGYRDPNNCSHCRCPDGLSGQFCSEIMDPVNETCGRKIKFATEKWLTLSTPGMYSRGPRLRSSCNWLIKTLPGKHVLLRVEKLTLDCWRQMACDEDYIAIRYKTNLALPGPRFCCDRPTKTFVSHGNQILLLYRIGDLYMNRGVRVAFKIEKCGGCTANSTTAQPACLETRERNCDAQYTAACVKDRTKKCNYTRKNNCLDTIKKCCTGYKLTGSECRPTAKWSEWSTSSTVCSVTCGNGTLTVTRTRKCSTGPGHCKGNSTATLNKPCSMKSCPVNGLWSTWKVTSTEPCTLTCGGGVIRIHRSRTCIPPMFGGADCQGLSQDIIKQPCNINPCPIDGVWSEWRTVSIEVCSVTCGGGVMEVILERTCTAPKFGGKDCQGDKRMSRSSQCNTHSCPVDGVWTEWKTILSGTCSVTCGGGVLVTVQERTCIAPKYGGKACQGNTTETRSKQCNSQHCPVDGVWSEWRTVSPGTCSVTCGRGVIETVLERTCIGPKFGGNDCQGNRRMTRSSRCNSKSCPVDGVWSEWRTVTTGSCSVTCGGGVMATVLERTCIGPRFGGKDCQGNKRVTRTKQCNTHICSVDGVWSEWRTTSIGSCSVTCGGGVMQTVLERTCIGPSFGGKDCQGEKRMTRSSRCNTQSCPVDGVWSEWRTTSIGSCSVTCGGGVIQIVLERTCIGPKFGGKDCQGNKRMSQTNQCNSNPCPVDGVWSEWRTTSIGSCSVTCGGGVMQIVLERTCIGPKFGGKDCQGNRRMTRSKQCNTHLCSVDGVWSEWRTTSIGSCSVTCGGGVMEIVLERTCIGPSFGGKDCQGNKRMTRSSRCNSQSCPVDGVWTGWRTISIGLCSVTCGGGVMETILERTCVGPKFGGKDCQGSKRMSKTNQCNSNPCPVDGVWSEWRTVSIGSCSVTCGGGVMQTVLERTCIGPTFGGKDCQGNRRMTRSKQCNTHICSVDGVWSEWRTTSIGSCSVSCGGGVMQIVLERTCIGPSFGGKDCQGNKRMTRSSSCNSQRCPVDGVWSEWKTISTGSCSVTCGGGVKQAVLERTCIGPSFGGKDCGGEKRMIRSSRCNSQSCPADGVWSEWRVTSTGPCSLSCGGGVMETVLERTCIRPSPGGNNCQGDRRMTRTNRCNLHPCPVDGVWSEWKTISSEFCSVTCGGGARIIVLERTCIGPSFGGKNCQGNRRMTQSSSCNSQHCPVDGVWTDWKTVTNGSCSVTCGVGKVETILERTCIGPKFGGKDCQGQGRITRSKMCELDSCPADGVWSKWRLVSNGTCSVTCGGGYRETTLERSCIPPRFGGKGCEGDARKTVSVPCNSYSCSRDGQWGAWKVKESVCSVSCGRGTETTTYTRTCDSPPPTNGGRPCVGNDVSVTHEICVLGTCPVDGQWGTWTEISFCSVTCGKGIRVTTRERHCKHPAPQFGGKICDGGLVQIENTTSLCDRGSCTVDGGWGPWEVLYSSCSQTCGLGRQIKKRHRKCDNPAPQNGGSFCPGGLLQGNEMSIFCHLRVCKDGVPPLAVASILSVSYTVITWSFVITLLLSQWL